MEEKMEKKKDSGSKNTEGRFSKVVERIALGKETIGRIDQWIIQIEEAAKAVRVTRSDVSNYILMKHSSELSTEDIEALKNLNFDEVKFSFWLARTLKMAKAKGENVTLDELYRQYGRSQN